MVTKAHNTIINVGEVEVVIERAGPPYRTKYILLSIVAWAFNLLALTSANPSDPPRIPYQIVIRRKGSQETLYQDGVYYGQEAFDAAKEFSDHIRRIGVDDFVFKTSHGWRID